tara:strand:+ start:83 stop:748 length:666 start_codon:yes stop_codon:yes gene_type:complete
MKKESETLEEGQLRITTPFGPSIAWAKIPLPLIEKLNNYVDKIIEDKEKVKKLDHGNKLVGDVTQEFLIENDFSSECGWSSFLQKGVAHWINYTTQRKVTKFELISSWVIRQFKGEYNPIHWHGGHISGVGYLKVPKNLGEPVQKESKRKNPNGHIELIHGTRMFLSGAKLQIKPEVGNFYFFPNYMMHTVYPFTDTEEERRSISFNCYIDDNIYNVYDGS